MNLNPHPQKGKCEIVVQHFMEKTNLEEYNYT